MNQACPIPKKQYEKNNINYIECFWRADSLILSAECHADTMPRNPLKVPISQIKKPRLRKVNT